MNEAKTHRLAARNILANQAYNAFSAFPEDALVRIAPDEIRKKGKVPKNGSIFFTIFQTFMSGAGEAPYFGEPVYTYSLKNGINDGFLTPFKVKQIQTTMDYYTFTSDDTVIEGEIEVGKVHGIGKSRISSGCFDARESWAGPSNRRWRGAGLPSGK